MKDAEGEQEKLAGIRIATTRLARMSVLCQDLTLLREGKMFLCEPKTIPHGNVPLAVVYAF